MVLLAQALPEPQEPCMGQPEKPGCWEAANSWGLGGGGLPAWLKSSPQGLAPST